MIMCSHCNKNPVFFKTILLIISLLIIYPILFLWVDKPIAYAFQICPLPLIFYKISLHIASILSPAHLLFVSILAFIFSFIAQKKNCKIYKIIGATGILAFIIAGVLKILLARYRPSELFEHGHYGFHFFSTVYENNSTPSGHATMIFALLGSIAWVIKKHWLGAILLSLCLLVSFSRIIVEAHFLSDLVFGMYIGLLSLYWVNHFYAKNLQ